MRAGSLSHVSKYFLNVKLLFLAPLRKLTLETALRNKFRGFTYSKFFFKNASSEVRAFTRILFVHNVCARQFREVSKTLWTSCETLFKTPSRKTHHQACQHWAFIRPASNDSSSDPTFSARAAKTVHGGTVWISRIQIGSHQGPVKRDPKSSKVIAMSTLAVCANIIATRPAMGGERMCETGS